LECIVARASDCVLALKRRNVVRNRATGRGNDAFLLARRVYYFIAIISPARRTNWHDIGGKKRKKTMDRAWMDKDARRMDVRVNDESFLALVRERTASEKSC